MKHVLNLTLLLSTWSIYVTAIPTDHLDSTKDVCDLLTSLSTTSELSTPINAIFFKDFKTGKDFISQGPLSIGGSFIGPNAFINKRTCHHTGPISKQSTNSTTTTPFDKCSVNQADTNSIRSNAIKVSRRFADMLPNWSIDKMGIIIKLVTEGIDVHQPYHVFTIHATCGAGPYQAKNYFACTNNRQCETPSQTLSDGHAMFLGKTSHWTGPIEQTYPKDNLVIFNIPVMEGQTFDIQTKNPSAGLSACNTIYNFYAVNHSGKFDPNGKFTLKRNSEHSLNGMILAPQAHVIDNATGSFAGQLIADSYESTDDGVQILDYQSADGEQCQFFTGCVTDFVPHETGNAGTLLHPDATDPASTSNTIDATVSLNSTIDSANKHPIVTALEDNDKKKRRPSV